MRKYIAAFILIGLMGFGAPVYAIPPLPPGGSGSGFATGSGAPSGSCTMGTAYIDTATGCEYACVSSTWSTTSSYCPGADGSRFVGAYNTSSNPTCNAGTNGMMATVGTAPNILLQVCQNGTGWVTVGACTGTLCTVTAGTNVATALAQTLNAASGLVGLAASPGTPDGTKFLRDDRTWQTAGSQVQVIDAHGASTSPTSAQLLSLNLFHNSGQTLDATVTWPTRVAGQQLYFTAATTVAKFFRVTAPAQCICLNGNCGTLYTSVTYTSVARPSKFTCEAQPDDTITGNIRIDCTDGYGALTGS